MMRGTIGAIITPRQRLRVPDGAMWCADNGCYGKGYPGDAAWLSWLVRNVTAMRERCAFAVAPDVVGDAAATWKRSAPYLDTIRALGVPAAFVAQDGLEDRSVPWDAFDVLFIGGSTTWKLGAAARELVADARSRGVPVHMGRVNSLRRFRYATALGCSSVDGTILTYGPDVNFPRVLAMLRSLDQLALWEGEAP